MREIIASDRLLGDSVASLYRVTWGFLLAAATAIPLGLVVGWSTIDSSGTYRGAAWERDGEAWIVLSELPTLGGVDSRAFDVSTVLLGTGEYCGRA